MTPQLIVGTLSAVALVLLLAGGWKWRSERATALLCLVAGGLVGTLAILKVWPALTDETAFAESELLRQQLSDARVALGESQKQATTRAAAFEALTERFNAHENATQRLVGTLEDSVADLHRRFRGAGGDVILDLPPRAPRTSGASILERGDTVAATLQDLHFLRARPAANPITGPQPLTEQASRQDQTRELVRLRDRLATPIKTEHYDIEPYPTRDLVSGRQGRYYAIDMKNADSGIRYFFDGGKYTLRTGTAEFRSSLNKFVADVLGRMEGNVRYDLYVRGSADQKPYEGRMESGSEYKQVTFLRTVGPDRYSTEKIDAQFERGIVRNTDLPNLRAAFMRDLVASTYPVKSPIILQGTVTPKTDERDRNVELILFVDW
jgi:hypothetical protein